MLTGLSNFSATMISVKPARIGGGRLTGVAGAEVATLWALNVSSAASSTRTMREPRTRSGSEMAMAGRLARRTGRPNANRAQPLLRASKHRARAATMLLR